ncbi:MAG: M48 family metalloprotease [Acidobacteriota bacterium]
MQPLLSVILTITIGIYGAGYPLSGAVAAPSGYLSSPQEAESLSQLVEKSYLELFRIAPELNLSDDVLNQFEDTLEDQEVAEEEQLEQREDEIEDKIEEVRDQLKELNEASEQSFAHEQRRHDIHCQIEALQKELNETQVALDQGLDVHFENKLAKVKLLREWPEEYRQFQQRLQSGGQEVDLKFSDFRDVGVRGGVFEDQAEDVEAGREAIEEMRRQGMLPPELEDEEVQEYVRAVANRIARHSDLKVPLKISVLQSEEVNAFALPGGFLFINAGLITEADKEDELAGVIAHEISHVAARHSSRLGTRANIANLVLQAAQLAGLIFTGGLSSIATYYALQYGLYGLGFFLSLSLLGVSRDYELEADILGTQYLWHSGYSLTGFIDFFSKMAAKEGYLAGASWFRTHPPFYERMETTYKEMLFLPDRGEESITDSQAFHSVKQRLEKAMEDLEQRDREAPTLRRIFHCEQECEGEFCP